MNFPSELKLQIQVTLRLISIVHFLHNTHMNQEEFDATSWLMKTHHGLNIAL